MHRASQDLSAEIPAPGVGHTRRAFLRACAASAVWASAPFVGGAERETAAAMTAAFDREVGAFMSARKVPGGALAVVRNRRLVYARGYGWADRAAKTPVGPESLFRIASISKPFTSVAVLQLVEQGKLSLDTPAFGLLKLGGAATRPRDPRLERITIRHLLQHTGGWDRDQSFDPMFRAQIIAKAQGVASPPAAVDIIRYMLDQPLDFAPGTRHAYSNFGYCVLGRVLEQLSGLNYERCMHERVLAPIGINRMQVGASLRPAEGEVRYYTPQDERGRSVFPGTAPTVPQPYGTFCLEAMDAHGGWIASATGLARFAAALDHPAHGPLLKPETLRTMYEPPPAPVSRQKDGRLEAAYYACGWMVRPVGAGGKANYWHTGSLPGTFTLLVRRWDGLSWAVLFNQRSADKNLPDGAIDSALHRAADAVKEWPDHDLFAR